MLTLVLGHYGSTRRLLVPAAPAQGAGILLSQLGAGGSSGIMSPREVVGEGVPLPDPASHTTDSGSVPEHATSHS